MLVVECSLFFNLWRRYGPSSWHILTTRLKCWTKYRSTVMSKVVLLIVDEQIQIDVYNSINRPLPGGGGGITPPIKLFQKLRKREEISASSLRYLIQQYCYVFIQRFRTICNDFFFRKWRFSDILCDFGSKTTNFQKFVDRFERCWSKT